MSTVDYARGDSASSVWASLASSCGAPHLELVHEGGDENVEGRLCLPAAGRANAVGGDGENLLADDGSQHATDVAALAAQEAGQEARVLGGVAARSWKSALRFPAHRGEQLAPALGKLALRNAGLEHADHDALVQLKGLHQLRVRHLLPQRQPHEGLALSSEVQHGVDQPLQGLVYGR